MKKILLILLVCLFLFHLYVFSQEGLPEFSYFTEEEKNLQECSFDKEANAIVLFDYGSSDYNERYNLITTRRRRIKILNEKGIENGTITIPFYSKGNFEVIREISALSYNIDEAGNGSLSYVDRKSIYTEKINQFYSVVKFAIPNVKAGSIIEYKYLSIKDDYNGLEDWVFQSAIPTVKSFYSLHMLPNIDFNYKVQKKDGYRVKINPVAGKGLISFEMNNIPGLSPEPFMDAIEDYIQKVSFQFAAAYSGYGYKITSLETWKDLATELIADKRFGGVLKKELSPSADLKMLISDENSTKGKIFAVYNYFRKNFGWNGVLGKFVPDGLKNTWEKKTGSASEINFCMLSILRSFDLEAYPLLIAERSYGKVDTISPFVDRFIKTAVYVEADNRIFILDASQRTCPPDLIPFPLLNTYAFLVDKSKHKLFRITSNELAYSNDIKIKSMLSENGILKGTVLIKSYDYAKQIQSENIKKDQSQFIRKNYLQPFEGFFVDSFHCENLEDDNLPLIQHINFSQELNKSGQFLFFNSNLFTGVEKNPFTKTERFTNVDFGHPYKITIEEEIELPKNCTLEEIPKNISIIKPGGDISISRFIEQKENFLFIKIELIQKVTLVLPSQYEGLRTFYRSMIEMLNEPIAIKLK